MLNGENFQNLRELLETLEEQRRGEVLIRYVEGETVREVDTETFFGDIRSFAVRLTRLGVETAHVGIIGPNCYEWLVSYYAILYVGATPVMMGAEYTPEELAETIKQADVAALVYHQVIGQRLKEAGMVLDTALIPMFCQGDKDIGVIADNHKTRSDVGCIFFTSGTTAKKKAVVMSCMGMIEGVCNDLVGKPFRAQLAILPFHHLAGFNPTLNTLCLGGVLCLAGDFKRLFRELELMKPDYFYAVPSIVKVLVKKLKHSNAHGESLGLNIRIINCGGAKFQPEVVETITSRDIAILQGYGASEAGGIGFSWEMSLENPNTIGKAPDCLEAKLVDGELAIRSKTLMMGYYKDPEATAEVLKDGWYYTGDLARQDEEGYYYLTGRKKNLIILSNGENISPEELEEALGGCEQVGESMVFEENDFLAVEIFPDYPANASEEEKTAVQSAIQDYVERFNETAPAYKNIRFVEFRETPFPKNATGKIVRRKEGKA